MKSLGRLGVYGPLHFLFLNFSKFLSHIHSLKANMLKNEPDIAPIHMLQLYFHQQRNSKYQDLDREVIEGE